MSDKQDASGRGLVGRLVARGQGRSWLAMVVGVALLTALGGDSLSRDVRAEDSQPTSGITLVTPEKVLAGLREFFAKTAREDGSFQPGIDPAYRGMSDSAYSDLAAVTYAVTIHKTFGWKLPHEQRTIEFLLGRQRPTGEFINVAGTVKPDSPEGRTYNTTQALVALKALGVKPKYDPLPVFDDVLKQDYKELPAYSTSFFPLAYLCAGRPIPPQADRGVRALMIQDRTGYLNDHIAATFHASHYYHLVGEPTPKATAMIQRIIRDQKSDGSWSLHMPSRDRHAAFDAVFTLRHEGQGRADCEAAIQRAARWALSCRNVDGGFGHYPGSTSDADANYFQVGTLVMAGFLKPVDPLPPDPHLLSWGHLMPTRSAERASSERLPLEHHWQFDGWVGGVAFSPQGEFIAAGASDQTVRVFDMKSGEERIRAKADGFIAAVAVSPDGTRIATGDYAQQAVIWDARTGQRVQTLGGHRGAVMTVAFHPAGELLTTGGIDGVIKQWETATGKLTRTLTGHKSWVNSLAYSPDGSRLYSGSSDGTVRVWKDGASECERTFEATDGEVRSVAVSRDGRWLAAGLRYGGIKVWTIESSTLTLDFRGHESDVWAVAFGPTAKTLYSANGDWNRPGHVKSWQLPTGEPGRSFQHTGEVLSMSVSADGRWLAAGAADGALRLRKIVSPE